MQCSSLLRLPKTYWGARFCMYLYKNKEQFNDAIVGASKSLKVNEALIEKDYFVMLLLSELNKAIPGLLFKGGTCCSHAYHAIDRFSEDIDLSLDTDHFGRNHNKEANHKVIEVCDSVGFKISNRSEVISHSHGSLNCYYVEYPSLYSSPAVKPYVQIEMAFYQKSYPHEMKQVNSLIGEWLISGGNEENARLYNLMPFEVCVQKLERTFIDKAFALCDYFERKEIDRNSRHIYDLYKISQIIDLSQESLHRLINEVRADRKKNNRCVSAADGYDINRTLMEITSSGLFAADYRGVTSKLLTTNVEYEIAITVLKTIVDLGLFNNG